jgi:hypothetical protein
MPGCGGLYRQEQGRPEGQGVFTLLHGVLLLSVLPLAVLWIPLISPPGLGTLTALDVVLSLLWVTTLLRLRGAFDRYKTIKRALRIAVYALMPAAFGVAGALLFDANSPLLAGFMQHIKRFGMPAIMPMALLVAPSKYIPRIRSILIVSVAFMLLIAFSPLGTSLPIDPAGRAARAADTRATGSLTNPNDYADLGIFGALAGLAYLADRSRPQIRRRCWAVLALGVGMTVLVTSASRSGMAAAIAAGLFIAFSSAQRVSKRVLLALCLSVAVFAGFRFSSTFHDRMNASLEQRMSNGSLYSRIEAQNIAIHTWLHHPLGVGFSNTYTATQPYTSGAQLITGVQGSDSIYVDFLLGTGVFGLACVLLCFRNCWDLARCPAHRPELIYLKAGLLSAFVFGLASVSPASYVVAPFFFSFAGLAGCLARQDSRRAALRAPRYNWPLQQGASAQFAAR